MMSHRSPHSPGPYGVQRSPLRGSLPPEPEPSSFWQDKFILILKIAVPMLLLFLLWKACYTPPLPSVVGLPEPTQKGLSKYLPLPAPQGYTMFGTHSYEVKALILSRRRYSSEPGSLFSPVDFALGWGVITRKPYVNQITWSQDGRWYSFRYGSGFPFPNSVISKNSANTHIVVDANNKELRKQILAMRRGQVVHLKGYLVVIRAKKGGWRWVSSQTRLDTGGGSCEVMYVTHAEVVPHP